jgi:hypothetical protein
MWAKNGLITRGYTSLIIITESIVLIGICQAGEFVTDHHRLLNTHTLQKDKNVENWQFFLEGK